MRPGGQVVDLDADLSRDGSRVLRAYGNGRIEVWDVGSRARDPAPVLHNGAAVVSAQFDRTGKYVVAGGDDGFARVWQVKPTRQLAVLRGHTDGVIRARFSPDGSQVATVSDDGSGRLWPSRPRPRSPLAGSAPRARRSARTRAPSSSSGAGAMRADSAVWNIDGGTIVPLQRSTASPMPDTALWPCGRAAGCSPWSPDGRFVAGVNAAANAVIWDARSGNGSSNRKGNRDGGRSGVQPRRPPRRRRVQRSAEAEDLERRDRQAGPVVPARRQAGVFPFSAQFVPNSAADPDRRCVPARTALRSCDGGERCAVPTCSADGRGSSRRRAADCRRHDYGQASRVLGRRDCAAVRKGARWWR